MRGARGKRQLAVALLIKLLELGDAALLLGIAAHQLLELLDLVAGQAPVAGIDRAAGLLVLVEHEAGERSLGARHVGADVADDQRDVIAMPLGAERMLARVIGEVDQEHHDDQDEGRKQARSRGSAATPIEAQFLPVPCHGLSLDPLTIWRKPKVP